MSENQEPELEREAGEDAVLETGIQPLTTGAWLALGCAAVCLLALLSGLLKIPFPVEMRAALGFALFFIAPGWALSIVIFPLRTMPAAHRLPAALALTMGLWALPGLVFYIVGAGLTTVMVFELLILLAVTALSLYKRSISPIRPESDVLSSAWNPWAAGAVALALAGLALYTGAFRAPVLDWDYFNYISGVKKLVAWDRASIAHYAYKGAPPDPIHSYNVWALQWALIAKLFRIDPIALYSKSAFLTVPLAALSFYFMASRLFNQNLARTALFIYAGYHVIYGGLVFVGRTTFYPADSQWLLVFPACVGLFTLFVDSRQRLGRLISAVILGLALPVLALSIVHVLWGLCFYITAALFTLSLFIKEYRVRIAFTAAWRERRHFLILGGAGLAAVPLLMALVAVNYLELDDGSASFQPLMSGKTFLPLWFYGILFVAVPLGMLTAAVYPYRRFARPTRGKDPSRKIKVAAGAVLICLAAAVPYIILRAHAVEATDWTQFGRNPYRAFITPEIYFLNPMQRSLANPNMTFFPLYLIGYVCLPAIVALSRVRPSQANIKMPFHQRVARRIGLRKRGRHRPSPTPVRRPAWISGNGAMAVTAVMIFVPLICFHPVLATLFSEIFSLGYLRRILRLAALFSILPVAICLHIAADLLVNQMRRPLIFIGLTALVAAAIMVFIIPAKAEPRFYNNMLKTTMSVARHFPRDSLIYDDEPFRLIAENAWFEDDVVVFSDIWTSYRLTAYLPLYVVVRDKPGTGVSDQDERRLLEEEFFDPGTTTDRMAGILDKYGASAVIVNRNPSYTLYGLSMGHPEAVGKLSRDDRFEKLHDKGDWTIFRYEPVTDSR